GATTAPMSASASIGPTTGATTAFAGTASIEIAWNWIHITGAVAMPHAAETAVASASHLGNGYPSSHRRRRGTSTKIASTATNDSSKPASNSVYGFQASSAAPPTSRKCQRSVIRALSHASEPSTPAIPARTTDGCGPTASTYAAIPASAPI